MEITAILQLVKDYGLTNVAIIGLLIYLLKGKIDGIGAAVKHVDEAVNNREPNDLTLSQEVRVIRKELELFKKESISILKDFKLLRKEGYLVAGELKADIEHINNNVKQGSMSTAELIKGIKTEIKRIDEDVDGISKKIAS